MNNDYLYDLFQLLTRRQTDAYVHITDKDFLLRFMNILLVLNIKNKSSKKSVCDFFNNKGYVTLYFKKETGRVTVSFQSTTLSFLKDNHRHNYIPQEYLLLAFSEITKYYGNIKTL